MQKGKEIIQKYTNSPGHSYLDSMIFDLEPEWTSDVTTGTYRPPDELILRHGSQLEDDGLTEKCLQDIKVRHFFLTRSRDGIRHIILFLIFSFKNCYQECYKLNLMFHT